MQPDNPTEIVPTLLPQPNPKKRRREDNRLMVLVFVMFVVVLLVTMVMVASYIAQLQTQQAGQVMDPNKPSDQTTLDTATWKLSKAEPVGSEYVLTVQSSIGNIRSYDKVLAYGLSNNQRYLALNTTTGLKLVDLKTNEMRDVQTPFAISGLSGDSISWSSDSAYFALGVFKDQLTTDTHILVLAVDGEVIMDLTTSLAFKSANNVNTVYPVLFSPTRPQILARTYMPEDRQIDAATPVNQLPAYLTAHNLERKAIGAVSLEEIPAGQELVYLWDKSGDFVQYLLTDGVSPVNYAMTGQFTTARLAE